MKKTDSKPFEILKEVLNDVALVDEKATFVQ